MHRLIPALLLCLAAAAAPAANPGRPRPAGLAPSIPSQVPSLVPSQVPAPDPPMPPGPPVRIVLTGAGLDGDAGQRCADAGDQATTRGQLLRDTLRGLLRPGDAVVIAPPRPVSRQSARGLPSAIPAAWTRPAGRGRGDVAVVEIAQLIASTVEMRVQTSPPTVMSADPRQAARELAAATFDDNFDTPVTGRLFVARFQAGRLVSQTGYEVAPPVYVAPVPGAAPSETIPPRHPRPPSDPACDAQAHALRVALRDAARLIAWRIRGDLTGETPPHPAGHDHHRAFGPATLGTEISFKGSPPDASY